MNRARVLISGALILVTAAWVVAQESLPQGTRQSPQAMGPVEVQHYSYAIGLDIGSNFRENETQLNLESLLAGVKDGLGGGKRRFDLGGC